MKKLMLLGLLGAWLNRNEKGFRQKDVRFYIELIADWMSTAPSFKNFKIQNTQTMRFLDSLCDQKWLIKKAGPIYFFNNNYFMSLIKEAFRIDEYDDYDLFQLQYHLATVYQTTILNLLFKRGVELSNGEKIDLELILSPKNLLSEQKKRIEKEIKVLQAREQDVVAMIDFSKKELLVNKPIEVVKKLEKLNPYKLQYYKSMSDTFKDLLPEIVSLELTEHSEKRINTLWNPLKSNLENYLKYLNKMS
jgi:hypothetical protein